jgi:hypothetical protein
MADYRERKKEDLYIKETRKSKNFFVTSSAKMTNDKDRTSTTISSSVFTKMKANFDAGDFLLDEHLISQNGSILYMMQQIQEDLEDVYNEVSASAFEASYFPFATIDSGSFGVISSSLVPDKDNKYDLGTNGREWNNLYVDGTAYIDSLDLNGTNITTTLNAKAIKTEISGAFTSLSASIATDIGNAGGGTVDTALKNGSTNAVQNNAVFDGLATKLNLSGGKMIGLIEKPYTSITAEKLSDAKGIIDARAISMLNIQSMKNSKGFTLILCRPSFVGQELTIIANDTGTIKHTAEPSKDEGTFVMANGKDISVAVNTAYKFVCNLRMKWIQLTYL